MKGHLQRRGERSWRLKYDIGTDATGERQIRYVTLRGTKAQAQAEAAKILASIAHGTHVDPSATTVATYLRQWLNGAHKLGGKTVERYKQLAEQQIIPHLGGVQMQKLRPKQIEEWHQKLLTSGGHKKKRPGTNTQDERPLSARTVGHAHRLLRTALQRAMRSEIVSRNVASVIQPPKVEEEEVEILMADQIPVVLKALEGHPLHCLVVLTLSSGARRGELLALTWENIDFAAGTLTITRSLEQTRAGLRFKPPKTKHGLRTIALPSRALEVLQGHRKAQLEHHLKFALGKPTLVFSTIEGDPIPPNNVSRDWWRFVKAQGLPSVSFHAARHTHVSTLVAANVDVVSISRRIGHGSPALTLKVYAHLFRPDDRAAAVMDAVLGRGGQ